MQDMATNNPSRNPTHPDWDTLPNRPAHLRTTPSPSQSSGLTETHRQTLNPKHRHNSRLSHCRLLIIDLHGGRQHSPSGRQLPARPLRDGDATPQQTPPHRDARLRCDTTFAPAVRSKKKGHVIQDGIGPITSCDASTLLGARVAYPYEYERGSITS